MDSDSLKLNDIIRSELPGRIRLRLPMLRGCSSRDIDWITQWIKSHNEKVSVTVNPLVGSILLTWDTKSTAFDVHPLLEEAQEWFEAAQSFGFLHHAADKTSSERALQFPGKEQYQKLLQSAQTTGNRILDTLSPWLAADVKQKSRKRRVTQNRLMLASLAASLMVLVTSESKSHVVLGSAFLALLSVHLMQHKKVL